jgi:hypothetical protein
MNLGLDFHGVITKEPEFFSKLSDYLVNSGNEVHIITGTEITKRFLDKLKNFDIKYTHLFSIVDYHKSIGTTINYENNGPWIDDEAWNKAKANYCKTANINIHVDDSKIYGRYFPKEITYLLVRNDSVKPDLKNKFMDIIIEKCKIPTCSAPAMFGDICSSHFLSMIYKMTTAI